MIEIARDVDLNKKADCFNYKGRGRYKSNSDSGHGPRAWRPIAEERTYKACNGTGNMTFYGAMKYTGKILNIGTFSRGL